jgi:hypothetical protein
VFINKYIINHTLTFVNTFLQFSSFISLVSLPIQGAIQGVIQGAIQGAIQGVI